MSTPPTSLMTMASADLANLTLTPTLLNQQTLSNSVLFVNVKELNLKLYNEIIISWNILETTSLHDWIGIYRPDSTNSSDHFDMQKVNGSKIGHITWPLHKLKSVQTRISANKTASHFLLSQDDILEFRYYSGLAPNQCYAKSIPLKTLLSSNISSNSSSSSSSFDSNINLINSNNNTSSNNNNQIRNEEFITFKVSDIKASQLRKGMFFNPDPYVKITVIPACANLARSSSYVREYKTFIATNTCFPNWKNESFVIVARESDRLLLECKDKFARDRKSVV